MLPDGFIAFVSQRTELCVFRCAASAVRFCYGNVCYGGLFDVQNQEIVMTAVGGHDDLLSSASGGVC